MKIETQPREDHQVTMIVEVEEERMEKARRQAARNIAKRVKIPGFRPGKAPYEVVRRQYGDMVITEEAVEILVDDIYPEALNQAEIKPAAAGQLETIENLDPPKFKFVVPLMPSVDLGDYQSIRKDYNFENPGEDKLDESLEELRRMYATTETVDREVQEGDFVLVDIESDTKIEDGDEKPDFNRSSFPVFIRKEDKEDEWPFSGFSKKLLGMNADESKSFSFKYPKDYSFEALRSKSIIFTVKVKSIRGVSLPELNDEFAQMVGGGETLSELREKVHDSLVQQAKSEYDDNYFVELVEEIKKKATLKYPPQVIEHEDENVLEELKNRLTQQGLDLETYMKMRQTSMEEFMEKEIRPVAIRRLERSLILDELARQEKIELDEDSLGAEFNNAWSALSATDENFQKATQGGKRASRDLVNAVAMDAANRLIVSRTLDRLRAIATGDLEKTKKPEAESGQKSKKSSSKIKEAPKKKPSKKEKSEGANEELENK